MEKSYCEGIEKHIARGDFLECPRCGNHVCMRCAHENGGVCPHCFSPLKRFN